MSLNFFQQIGGRSTIEKISKIFYDKVYKHPWLKQYFANVSQEHIESQQSDFLQSAFGGGKIYSGRLPLGAHQHMNITEDLYAVRHRLMEESLREFGLNQDQIDHWLRIDDAFRSVLIKKGLADCKKRYNTDDILDYPNPNSKIKQSA